MDSPPTWNAAGNGLQGIATHLLIPEVIRVLAAMAQQMRHMGLEKGLPEFYALERKTRSQVSLRARRMTRTEGPMEMPTDLMEAAWLVLRCNCACDFLGQLHPPLAKEGPCGDVKDGWTAATTAGWLLTELWERKADTWLKLVAVEWIGPFPFYGIEPAPEWM